MQHALADSGAWAETACSSGAQAPPLQQEGRRRGSRREGGRSRQPVAAAAGCRQERHGRPPGRAQRRQGGSRAAFRCRVAAEVTQPPGVDSASSPSPADPLSLKAATEVEKETSLAARVLSGALMAVFGVFTIFAGGLPFTAVTCLVVYQTTQEYFGFMTSKGISKGLPPPPALISVVTTLLCIGISVWTYATNGTVTAALAVCSLALLSLQLVVQERPPFSQLSSSVFGLFYCGYLPSFWVKLRLMAAPSVHTRPVSAWPVLFGGISTWTVGLVATLLAVACVAAADIGAFGVGRTLGRTKLISISPRKTREGAVGGLAAAVAAALLVQRGLRWPATPGLAAGLGVLVFLASLAGDLIESSMKREAGLKDAGGLIPGHGGILDRFDSYTFTGAVVFFVLNFVLPVFGL